MEILRKIIAALSGDGWRFVGDVDQPWTWQMRRKVNGVWEHRQLTREEMDGEKFFNEIVFHN